MKMKLIAAAALAVTIAAGTAQAENTSYVQSYAKTYTTVTSKQATREVSTRVGDSYVITKENYTDVTEKTEFEFGSSYVTVSDLKRKWQGAKVSIMSDVGMGTQEFFGQLGPILRLGEGNAFGAYIGVEYNEKFHPQAGIVYTKKLGNDYMLTVKQDLLNNEQMFDGISIGFAYKM